MNKKEYKFIKIKKVSGSIGSDAQDLINVLMRKVTRRIPYTNTKL